MASSVPAIGAFFFLLVIAVDAASRAHTSSAPTDTEAPSDIAPTAPTTSDVPPAAAATSSVATDESLPPSSAPSGADDDDLISAMELCNQISHSDFCLTTLAPDGKASEKSKVKDLASLAILKTKNKALETAAYISSKDSNENPDRLKNCLRDCANGYKTVVHKLTLAEHKIDNWTENSINDANTLVADSETLVRRCQVGCAVAIKRRNILTKRNRDVYRLCSIVQSIFEVLDTQ